MVSRIGRLACILVLLGFGEVAGEDDFATERRRRAAKAEAIRIERELAGQTEMPYVDVQLGDVVNDLELRHKINFELDLPALTAEGLGGETPIRKTLGNVPLAGALDHLLREKHLTWRLQNGIVLITTARASRALAETKVYSLAGLADERTEPDYEAVVEVIEASVFRVKRFPIERTIRPYRPTRSLVAATNPLEQREIARLIDELIAAKRYQGKEKTLPPPKATDTAINGALTMPNGFKYEKRWLEEVEKDLEQRYRVNIEFDLDPGIQVRSRRDGFDFRDRERDLLVNYQAEGVPLAAALDEMLAPLGLTWTRDEVAIVVTDKNTESDYSMRRMYRVGDLAGNSEEMHDLADLIRQMVAVETWAGRRQGGEGPDALGNPAGEIAPFPPAGVLVVTQTPRTQRAIGALLEDLRETKGDK